MKVSSNSVWRVNVSASIYSKQNIDERWSELGLPWNHCVVCRDICWGNVGVQRCPKKLFNRQLNFDLFLSKTYTTISSLNEVFRRWVFFFSSKKSMKMILKHKNVSFPCVNMWLWDGLQKQWSPKLKDTKTASMVCDAELQTRSL